MDDSSQVFRSENLAETSANPAYASGVRRSTPDVIVIAGRYVLETHLATGGMGELFVARHVLTQQRVALKLLNPQVNRDDVSVARFQREVRAAARVGHPAVVQVFDAGVHHSDSGEEVRYLAMELLDGRDLSAHFAAGGVTQLEALDDFMAALEPVAAAHAVGIVHRDLKAENIFLQTTAGGGSRVRLLDFGIARESYDQDGATAAGQVLGTVYYMAPEQTLDARSATPASDVWSLGALLYQILSGRFPFDGDTPAAVLLRVCRDPHVSLTVLRPDLPRALTTLIDRCLDKFPDQRPGDAAALRDELVPLTRDAAVRALLATQYVDPSTFTSDAPAQAHDPYAVLRPPMAIPEAVASVRAKRGPRETPTPLKETLAGEVDDVAAAPAASPLVPSRTTSRARWALVVALVCASLWGVHRVHRASNTWPRPVRSMARVAATVVAKPAPLPQPVIVAPHVEARVEPRLPEPVVAQVSVLPTRNRRRAPRERVDTETTPETSAPTMAPPDPTPAPAPAPPSLDTNPPAERAPETLALPQPAPPPPRAATPATPRAMPRAPAASETTPRAPEFVTF